MSDRSVSLSHAARSDGKLKRLTLCLFAALAGQAFCQDAHPLYTSGQFPVGQFYNEASVRTLIDKEIPEPAYLVGRFVYLPSKDEREDFKCFCTFGGGLSNAEDIGFGDILMGVKFFNNAPALTAGKTIVSTENDPLTIRTVKRSDDGKYVMIAAESWSQK